jgi:Arc/MetJ-type ribon-helix-helix transcriptional regulator
MQAGSCGDLLLAEVPIAPKLSQPATEGEQARIGWGGLHLHVGAASHARSTQSIRSSTLSVACDRKVCGGCSTIRATLVGVAARSLHVRLDDSAAAALDVVRSSGLSDSEAVRTALREAAARRRVRSSIAEEVRRLAADSDDRREMQLIREQLADLAPSLPE